MQKVARESSCRHLVNMLFFYESSQGSGKCHNKICGPSGFSRTCANPKQSLKLLLTSSPTLANEWDEISNIIYTSTISLPQR